MGEPNARSSSKPARIAIVSRQSPERAEFFALPIVGTINARNLRILPSSRVGDPPRISLWPLAPALSGANVRLRPVDKSGPGRRPL